MLNPLQGGRLPESIKAVVKESEGDVKALKLMQSLAKQSDLPEILNNIGAESQSKPDQLQQVRDVTDDFLSNTLPQGPELPKSPIQIYKGLIKRLSATKVGKDKGMNQVGVLAGKAQRAQDVILGSTVLEVIENQEVICRWQELKYDVIGVVTWGQGERQEYEHQLNQVWGHQEQLVLLIIDGMESPRAWLAERPTGSDEVSFKAVSVDSSGANRLKGDDFVVLPATQVAVSLHDQARFDTNKPIRER